MPSSPLPRSEFQALLPCPKVSHAGHFIETSSLSGMLSPGRFPVHVLSIRVNRLDLGPTYPKNPRALGEYIRKFRMDKGLLIGVGQR